MISGRRGAENRSLFQSVKVMEHVESTKSEDWIWSLAIHFKIWGCTESNKREVEVENPILVYFKAWGTAVTCESTRVV